MVRRSGREVGMTTKAKPARKANARRPAKQKAPPAASTRYDLPAPLTDEQREAAIALLRSWREASDEEAREQQETWEYLKKALDEDRMSYRKLFP
jgi:hypothetical protein